MMKKTGIKIVLSLFLITVLLEIYAVFTGRQGLERVVKPLIVPILAVFYSISVKRINYTYLLALFFSTIGDIFMMFAFDDMFFTLALLSFLITQLTYIKITKGLIGKLPLQKMMLPFLLFVTYLGLLVLMISDKEIHWVLAVFVYGLVIIIFGVLAYINSLKTKSKANFLLFLGAFSFIACNSLIALNRFYLEGAFHQSIVIVTYISAQFLICNSFALRGK